MFMWQWDSSKSDGQYKKTASNKKLRQYLPNFEFMPIHEGIIRGCVTLLVAAWLVYFGLRDLLLLGAAIPKFLILIKFTLWIYRFGENSKMVRRKFWQGSQVNFENILFLSRTYIDIYFT